MTSVTDMIRTLPTMSGANSMNTLIASIQSTFTNMSTAEYRNSQANATNQRATQVSNQNFFEIAKKVGGDAVKTREQTLQEFVLYFFLASILFLGAAIAITTYTSSGAGAAFRMVLLYAVGMFVLCAMILRYA
jgi:hypothetical protein